MGAIRIVLYAEGAGETGTDAACSPYPFALWAAPGVNLPPEQLGAAHLLVRRSVAAARGLPEEAIRFEVPLRTRRGHFARGSDLLDRRTLRQLCSWPSPRSAPDVAIVLVDRDCNSERPNLLRKHVTGLHDARIVIAIAREEFEAWLIADERAASLALDIPLSRSPEPETMARREAKQVLATWIVRAEAGDRELAVRKTLSSTCDLETLRTRCSAYDAFYRELVALSL